MTEAKEEAVVCGLCGGPIEKVKGQPENVYKEEMEQRVHRACNITLDKILLKHNVRQEDHNNALFLGILELIHVEKTEAMKGFSKRAEEATKEAHTEFPFMAAMAQQAKPQPQQQQKTIEVKRKPTREQSPNAREPTKAGEAAKARKAAKG